MRNAQCGMRNAKCEMRNAKCLRPRNDADSRKQGGAGGSVLSYVTDGDNAADAEDTHSGARDTRLPPMRGYAPQRPKWHFNDLRLSSIC